MSSAVLVLAARGQRSSHIRNPTFLTFDDLVAAQGADLVSYWKFENTGTDQQGISNATISGFPELNVPTIVSVDTLDEGAEGDGKVIAWPGTAGEFAEAAHSVAHKTGEGTIFVYFQRDTASEVATLVMADETGAAGGFAIGVNTNGSIFGYIRGFAGVPTQITGGAGDVVLDHAYCLAFKWGPPGLSLSLHDANGLVRRVSAAATAGLTGSSPIRFGATHSQAEQHDGPYGRVVWLQRRLSDAEEAPFGARAKTIARSASAYRELVLSMGPLALWGMGAGGSTVVDAIGNRNGSFSGPVITVVDLPANGLGGATDFGGSGFGTIPHDVGMLLPAFTLSFWFRLNRMPTTAEAFALVSKTSADGLDDFIVYVPSNNINVVRARFRNGAGTIFDQGTAEGLLVADVPHHCAVRADTTGFDIWLDGVNYCKNVNYTGALSTNTDPWGFAASALFAVTADVVLDEAALFNRVLTDGEVRALAQASVSPPVAADDTVAVPEADTTAIPVLENDTFVGTPTITIMSQPAGGDSVAVSGQAINYTAGAVAVDTARSFTYRITDPNSTSNTATVGVTVLAVQPASDQANCYNENLADDVTVTTMAALEAAIDAAPPGRTILIAPGTYAGGTRTLVPQGTTADPIVVRPDGALGSVIINDVVWSLTPASSRVVFSKIAFNQSRINIQGNNHRVTRCRFRDVRSYCVNFVGGFNHRVDHCDVSDWFNNVTPKGFVDVQNGFATGGFSGILIDYNHIHDINHPAQVNASSVVDTNSTGTAWSSNTGIVIDHNLIENCPAWPDAEFITIKHSGSIIRFNTFRNLSTAVYLQQRQGGGWEVRSNWFETLNANFLHGFNDTGAGDGPQLIIGKRFEGNISMWVASGNHTVAGPANAEYHASIGGQIIGNSMDLGSIKVGEYWNNNENTVNAQNNNLFENTRDAGGNAHTLVAGNQTGTTFVDPGADPSFDYAPAVELIPVNVGTGAPDPLCPSGPQS